jgi:D-aminopeptidase
MSQPSSKRARIRDVLPNLPLGRWPAGPLNSITDVPGVLVSTKSVHAQADRGTNTGVTAILPRKDWRTYSSFAGVFSFNGAGELTGSHWINETGLLTTPIVLTGTMSMGDAFRGVLEYCYRYYANEEGEMDLFMFACVGETYDGFLNDCGRFAVSKEHVIEAILDASADRVPEGNTGGGTGMICHRYKGGTGSSSRVIEGFDADGNSKSYTVGVLVQANYGTAENLHIGGIPVGSILKAQQACHDTSSQQNVHGQEPRKDGSIIIIIATDVPLLPIQLQRLAKRATVGLGKVGGYGNNTSGDIFLAFSTANKIPFGEMSMSGPRPTDPYKPKAQTVEMSDNDTINSVFEAVADATEEAIYNSMFMAETMVGFKDRKVEALDLNAVREIVNKRLL